MSGNGFTVSIGALPGATPAPSALYDELYTIISDNIRRVAKRKVYQQVTDDFLSAAREDGSGRDDAITFGFHDSGGLCSASVHACDHWFALYVSALAEKGFHETSPLDEIAARHGVVIRAEIEPLAELLETCAEPLVELRGHLYGICGDGEKRYLVEDDLDDERLEIENLKPNERAKVDAAVKAQRCECAVCEHFRASGQVRLPKVKKPPKPKKIQVEGWLSDDKTHRTVDDASCTKLPDEVFAPASLQSFGIRAPVTTIPEAFGRLQSLRSLWMTRCKIEHLPEVMTKMPGLVKLSLTATPLHLRELAKMPWLETLELSDLGETLREISFDVFPRLSTVKLSGLGLKELPESLYDAPALRALAISDRELVALPSLERLSKLEKLTLSLAAVETLPSLANLTALRELSISCAALRQLPELPAGLRELSITAPKVSTLPESFAALASLETLLMYCPFTDVRAACAISSLKWLRIMDAPLHDLPQELGELAGLQRLEVLETKLEKVPDAVRRLKALTSLDLTGNEPLTTIPEWIGELEALEVLDLSRLPALGPLPSTISRLKNLKYLTLDDTPGAFPIADLIEKLPLGYLSVRRSGVSKEERARLKTIVPKAQFA